MAGDVQLTALQTKAAPLNYRVPSSAVIRVKSIRAEFTDNGAGGDWLPAVQLISDSGHVIATASDQGSKVTAGGAADASFFPGVKHAAATTTTLEPEWGQVYRGFVDAAQSVPAFTNVYAQWLHLVRSNDAQSVFDFGTIVSGNDGLTFAAQGMYLCLAAATFAVPDALQSIHIQPAAFPLNYTEDTGYATTNGTNTTVFDWQLVVPQGVNQIQGVQLRNGTAAAKDVAGVSLAVYYLPNPVQY